MVSKERYGRVSGMMSLAQNGSGIIAPLIAGTVLTTWGLIPVFVFDIASFCIAVALLLAVDIPQPRRSQLGQEASGSLWKETVFGWRYIVARRPLLWLQLCFFGGNLIASVCMTLWNPMILARTNDSSQMLGVINTVSAIGGVVGGAVLTAWGGPRRKVQGVLWGMVCVSVFGIMLMGLGRTLPVWLISGFLGSLIVPFMNGCNDAIWQAKVPHDVQGKVFGTRMMIAQVSVPVAMLTAGPLADKLFEPRMMPGGSWVSVFGALTGSGRGAGMALMYVLFGAAALLLSIVSFAIRDIRDVETLLPDYAPLDAQDEQIPAEEQVPVRVSDGH
jgi:MFS family permease